ncbi:hypothetical protein EXIGLDRAFT_728646 [Exidia glandulosa HHB12029]|uniref:Uncharacterized protein n=1 Tax=Exidia glandulosa HHB12029 TaxID=1314781 RepID=A0A166B628_EXIGL|nr:hypothetical protein EXIGLDRAFT_728646 [Exidia glandulosa HHB12029]
MLVNLDETAPVDPLRVFLLGAHVLRGTSRSWSSSFPNRALQCARYGHCQSSSSAY